MLLLNLCTSSAPGKDIQILTSHSSIKQQSLKMPNIVLHHLLRKEAGIIVLNFTQIKPNHALGNDETKASAT